MCNCDHWCQNNLRHHWNDFHFVLDNFNSFLLWTDSFFKDYHILIISYPWDDYLKDSVYDLKRIAIKHLPNLLTIIQFLNYHKVIYKFLHQLFLCFWIANFVLFSTIILISKQDFLVFVLADRWDDQTHVQWCQTCGQFQIRKRLFSFYFGNILWCKIQNESKHWSVSFSTWTTSADDTLKFLHCEVRSRKI